MSFEVKVSLFKQDQEEKYNYDSGRVFRSEEFSNKEACREEMFGFFRPWSSKGVENVDSQKNFQVVREFFYNPPIILDESYLAFQNRGFMDIHLIEVRGGDVSMHEKGVARSVASIENTMKRVKKSLAGAAFREGESHYEIFRGAEAVGKKDLMLSHFVNSSFHSVRIYSASYMELETTYSVTPRRDFIRGCEDRLENDPFNGFFRNPPGGDWE